MLFDKRKRVIVKGFLRKEFDFEIQVFRVIWVSVCFGVEDTVIPDENAAAVFGNRNISFFGMLFFSHSNSLLAVAEYKFISVFFQMIADPALDVFKITFGDHFLFRKLISITEHQKKLGGFVAFGVGLKI